MATGSTYDWHTPSVTLPQLLERIPALRWQEAVAIVRAICGEVMWCDITGNTSGLPRLEEVLLDGRGKISFSGELSAVADPVKEAGAILATLLERTDPPADLRQCVSRATAGHAEYTSILQFSHALGSFDADDPDTVLSSLFERAFHTTSTCEPAQAEASALDAGQPCDAAADLPYPNDSTRLPHAADITRPLPQPGAEPVRANNETPAPVTTGTGQRTAPPLPQPVAGPVRASNVTPVPVASGTGEATDVRRLTHPASGAVRPSGGTPMPASAGVGGSTRPAPLPQPVAERVPVSPPAAAATGQRSERSLPPPSAQTPSASDHRIPSPPIAHADSRAQSGQPIRLAHLLSGNVQLHWFEAVALLQAISGRCASSGAAGQKPAVPSLDQVELEASGTVAIHGHSPDSQDPVRQLGHMLSTLLEGTAAPAELRLCVSQATFEFPLYASIEDLSRALSYFERPDRAGVLRELYERAVRELPADFREQEKPRQVDQKKKQAKPSSVKRPLRFSRRHALVAAVVVMAAASALLLASMGAPLNAGTWFTGAVEGPRRLAGAATELSADAAAALLAAAGIRAAAPDPPAADPDPEPPVASTPRSRRLAPVTADGSESGVSASSPIAARTPLASWIAAPIDGRNRLLEGNGRTMIAEADEALEAISQRVFTVWDSDVEPPVLMHPALPSNPPPGMHLDEVGVVEVTVGPTGDVEGIRLLSAATRYQERMILSAIKAWQFEPATKEGTPVRYRLRVRVTL